MAWMRFAPLHPNPSRSQLSIVSMSQPVSGDDRVTGNKVTLPNRFSLLLFPFLKPAWLWQGLLRKASKLMYSCHLAFGART